MRSKVVWSPVEIDYLKTHRNHSPNQLCIALAKSRNALKTKLQELDGKITNPAQPKEIRSKIGKRPDCDGQFFRSSWEANVFRLLKTKKRVKLIEYEPKDFTFWQFGHHKGTVSYTPDFRVTYRDGSIEWIEVKGGLMKQPDKTKIRRFKKYYPDEFKRLVAITPGPKSKTAAFMREQGVKIKWYYPELNKKFKNQIPGWE